MVGRLNRRTVLKGGAALALATTAPSTRALADSTVVRRSIATLAANDPIVEAYRKAVAAMKALPATDPRNWTRQARIHNDFCPHGNWYFMPWHRAYLVAFERICRQLSGDANFALPYWDWTANPQLPAFFATPTLLGQPNTLFDSTRSSQTVTIPNSVAGPARISALLAETSFEVFGSSRPTGQNSTAPTWLRAEGIEGPFESGPHNQVHIRISGNMASFMSPRDPIFWLHHCNIDRLWDSWNRLGRSNSSNPFWLNFAFNGHFVNPSGASGTTPFNVNVSGLSNIDALGYRYVEPVETALAAPVLLAKAVDLSSLQDVARLTNIAAAKINTPLDLRVRLSPVQATALEAVKPIGQIDFGTSAPTQAPGRIIAIIRDVESPRTGNAEVRVFVNSPNLTPETPPEDRHFAGSFTFFGAEHAEHGGKRSYLIDLTQTVMKLRHAEVDFANEINVQLMPVPIPGVPSATEFKLGGVEVAIL